MSASINKLNDHGREDRFLVPCLPIGEPYQYDDGHIVVVKDKAQAATNAIAVVFEAEIHEAMCVTHAAIRWMSTNAGKFMNQDNKNRCIRDINHAFKIVAHIKFVGVARRLMMEKWVKEYGEPMVARDWIASWGGDILTRIENCQAHLCPLRGAVPCDNNALEAGNAADKSSLTYKKTSLFGFVDNVATKIVAPTSMKDTMFESRLKGNSHTKMNASVYNIKYFVHIAQLETLDFKGYPTCIHLRFDYTDVVNDVPPGSFLVAGAHCLNEMRQVEELPASVFEDKEKCRKWLGGRNTLSWVNVFKNFVRDPEGMVEDPLLTFDVFSSWSKCFHIIRPIIPDGGRIESAIRYYCEWMSCVNQFPMISADEVIDRKKKGLVSCTCRDYLHYCFCKHTFLILKKRKIYLGYPPTMCPVAINKRKRSGRPRDIHRGEALNRDG